MNKPLPIPAIPTLNIALLLRVADTIAKYPHAFDMCTWDCGTTACIAGWALRLSGTRHGMFTGTLISSKDAARLLGLSMRDAEQLFFRINWPSPFTRNEHAVERIHHFIRTGL